MLAHYEAPLLPAVMLLVVVGWRSLARWRWKARPVGLIFSRATVFGFVVGAGIAVAQPVPSSDVLREQRDFLKAI